MITLGYILSSVQSLSSVQLSVTPWTTAHQASLSITNFQSLLKHMSTKSVMPSYHLIFCRPLLLLPSISPSIRVFFNSSHEVAKVLEFQPQHHPFQGIPGLVSFRMDWLDLFAVQGTHKSLSSTTGVAAERSQPTLEVKGFSVVNKAEVDVFL